MTLLQPSQQLKGPIKSDVVIDADVAVQLPEKSLRSTFALVATLFKLRIVVLLLLSAFGGAALGVIAGGQFSSGRFWLLALTGTLSAAGASAINQYLERDRDGKMKRTAKRPFVQGELKNPAYVFYLAVSMVVGASIIAWLAGNLPLAIWLFAGAAIYVGVYTIWLKPRTSVNIVIGGAAGSCAVIAGGAAMDAQWSLAVWLLAGMLFTWTPVHFWALALAYKEDYKSGAYPMLPALVSPKASAVWIALHSVLTIGLALSIGLFPSFDSVMLALMGLVSIPLAAKTIRLLQRPEQTEAFALFHTSNLFLAAVLVVAMLSVIWRI